MRDRAQQAAPAAASPQMSDGPSSPQASPDVWTPRTPRAFVNLGDEAATPLHAARSRKERGTSFASREAVYDIELGEALVHGMPRRPKATMHETRAAHSSRIKLQLRDGSVVTRELETVRAFALMLVEQRTDRGRVWL